jgi:hypothetical protein
MIKSLLLKFGTVFLYYIMELKSDDMKTVLARLGVADNVPLEKFKKGTAILMILFFLVFGAASLFVLINSAA